MLKNLFNSFKAYMNDESGQGMVEYALIIALIAIVVVGVITALTGNLSAVFTKITEALQLS